LIGLPTSCEYKLVKAAVGLKKERWFWLDLMEAEKA